MNTVHLLVLLGERIERAVEWMPELRNNADIIFYEKKWLVLLQLPIRNQVQSSYFWHWVPNQSISQIKQTEFFIKILYF